MSMISYFSFQVFRLGKSTGQQSRFLAGVHRPVQLPMSLECLTFSGLLFSIISFNRLA